MPSKSVKQHNDFVVKNDFACAELCISCECNVCLSLVNTSRSEELPEGNAYLAWTNLVTKFAPVTKFNLVKTKKELIDSRLADASQDPDKWIQNLEIQKQRLAILGHLVSEMERDFFWTLALSSKCL
jgi:hypothetical protein